MLNDFSVDYAAFKVQFTLNIYKDENMRGNKKYVYNSFLLGTATVSACFSCFCIKIVTLLPYASGIVTYNRVSADG